MPAFRLMAPVTLTDPMLCPIATTAPTYVLEAAAAELTEVIDNFSRVYIHQTDDQGEEPEFRRNRFADAYVCWAELQLRSKQFVFAADHIWLEDIFKVSGAREAERLDLVELLATLFHRHLPLACTQLRMTEQQAFDAEEKMEHIATALAHRVTRLNQETFDALSMTPYTPLIVRRGGYDENVVTPEESLAWSNEPMLRLRHETNDRYADSDGRITLHLGPIEYWLDEEPNVIRTMQATSRLPDPSAPPGAAS